MISDDQRLKLNAYVKKSSKKDLYHCMVFLYEHIERLRDEVRSLKLHNVVQKTMIDAFIENKNSARKT